MSTPFSLAALPDESGDGLGIGAHVAALCDLLPELADGTVVALYGEWGQGKSSFLNMMQGQLAGGPETKPTLRPVRIPLWQYEKANDLLYSISRDAAEQTITTFGRFGRRVRLHGEEALIAFSCLVRGIGRGVGLVDVAEKRDDFKKFTEELRSKHFLTQDEHEALLAKLRGFFPSNGDRFVVLIDDLDRCEPELAVTLLVELKELLHGIPCLFVLGLNPNAIREAVAAKYQQMGFDDPGAVAWQFTEKLIDLCIPLPPVSVKASDRLLKVLARDHPDVATLSSWEKFMLLAGAPLNPRAIKRLLLSLQYSKRVANAARAAEQQSEGLTDEVLSESASSDADAARVKRLIVVLFYPPLARFALGHPAEFRSLQDLRSMLPGIDVEAGPAGAAATLRCRAGEDATWFPALLEKAAELLKGRHSEIFDWITDRCPHILSFLAAGPAVDLAKPEGQGWHIVGVSRR